MFEEKALTYSTRWSNIGAMEHRNELKRIKNVQLTFETVEDRRQFEAFIRRQNLITGRWLVSVIKETLKNENIPMA